MGSLNTVTLLGNLGADPVVRFTPTGKKVANLSLATTERWTDRESGEKKERTEWHRVVLWGRRAEIAEEFLKKGSPALIEGSNRTRSWTDKDGVKRYTTEVVARRLQLVGKPNGGSEKPPATDEPPIEEPAFAGHDEG